MSRRYDGWKLRRYWIGTEVQREPWDRLTLSAILAFWLDEQGRYQ